MLAAFYESITFSNAVLSLWKMKPTHLQPKGTKTLEELAPTMLGRFAAQSVISVNFCMNV